jgi:hypothetical protein
MGLGGLIAGALGGAAKGYTEVAETNLKKDAELDLKKQLLDAQAAKDLAIDEIKRNRDVSDIGRTSAATAAAALANAPTTAQAAVAGKVAEATAIKGSGLSALQAENTAADLAANKNNVTEKARQAGLAEGAGAVAKINTPGYLKATADNARAGHIESAGSLAQAALATFDLGQKRSVADLNKSLSTETDPTKREEITQKIKDLSGGSTKSFSDVVALGNGYVNMAGKLRTQAKDEADETARASMNAQATQYEQAADSVFNSVKEKRLGASPAKPGADKVPYPDGTRLQKTENGKPVTYVVKGGVPVKE